MWGLKSGLVSGSGRTQWEVGEISGGSGLMARVEDGRDTG